MAGILFRKIETGNQLALYHDKINTNYLIQEFVEMPLEIGIFYIRLPDADKGKITALFCKKFPVIQGDGISSLEQLLQKNQIPVTDETVKLSGEKLRQILPENETFHLSFVGNRYHGASFHDLSDEIDESLLDVVDKLSQRANFFYGRYDIKCASIDDLKKGKNFTVLEFNGAGSIVNHVYTDRFTLRSAYREICNHWKALSAISVANHKKGIPYWSAVEGYKYLRRAKKNLHMQKKLDKEIILSNEATTFNL